MGIKLFKHIRSLTDFVSNFKINPIYFILAAFLSLAASLFEGLSAGLLIPLVKGLMGMNFDFIKSYPLIEKIALRLPGLFNNYNFSALTLLLGLIVISIFAKDVLKYIAAITISRQVRRLSNNMRVFIFKRYVGFGKLFFDRNSPGRLQNILMGFTQRIAAQLTLLHSLFNDSLTIIVYLFLMCLISAKLTAIVLIFAPAMHYSLLWIRRQIKATSASSAENEARLARALSNTLSCIPIIKFYSYEDVETKKFSDISSVIENLEFNMDKKQSLSLPIQEIIILVSTILLVLVMVFMASGQKMIETAPLLVYFYLLKKCAIAFNSINLITNYLAMISGPIKEVRKIFDDNDKYFVPDGKKTFTYLNKMIEFRGLSFSYSAGADTLRNVTFTIEKGKMTAVVGPTGAGKTTLINLLVRFYDCPSSSIYIDGVDIREFNLATLRSRMAIVSQDTLLFDDTIKNNITYGIDKTISDESLLDILKKSRLYDYVMKLPAGINTCIGDRGVQLSGGEKQRVAIARALLREPDILILDEATSSLDTKTETLIQEAIEEAIKGKTTIVIAHRLSTIKKADKIVTIEDGHIVEEGKLTDLLAKNGKFFQYWEAQKFS